MPATDMKRRVFTWISATLCALALVSHTLNLSFSTARADQRQYLSLAYNALAHHVYSEHSGDTPAPTLKREPGYPAALMLGMVLHPGIDIDGDGIRCLTGVQADCIEKLAWLKLINVVFLVLATWLSSRLVFERTGSLLAGTWCLLMVGFGSSFAQAANRYLSDVQGAFLLLCFCSLLARHAGGPRRRMVQSALIGIAAGLLVLTKPIFLYFTPLLIGTFFLLWKESLGTKQTVRAISGLALALGAIVLPWLLRNWLVLDEFAVAGRSGLVMTARTELDRMTADQYGKSFVAFGQGPGFANWRKQLLNAEDVEFFFGRSNFREKAYAKLSRERENQLKRLDDLPTKYQRRAGEIATQRADRALRKDAMLYVLRHPGRHLAATLSVAWRGLFVEKGIGFSRGPQTRKSQLGAGTVAEKYLGRGLVRLSIPFDHGILPLNLGLFGSMFSCFAYSIWKREWWLFCFTLPAVFGWGMLAGVTHYIPRYSILLLPVLHVCFALMCHGLATSIGRLFPGLSERSRIERSGGAPDHKRGTAARVI